MVNQREQESEQSQKMRESHDFGDTQVFDFEELQRERRLMSLLLKERYRHRYETQDIDPDYFDEEFQSTTSSDDNLSNQPTTDIETSQIGDRANRFEDSPTDEHVKDFSSDGDDNELLNNDEYIDDSDQQDRSVVEPATSWFSNVTNQAGEKWDSLKQVVVEKLNQAKDSKQSEQPSDNEFHVKPHKLEANQVNELIKEEMAEHTMAESKMEANVINDVIEVDNKITNDIPIIHAEDLETKWQDDQAASNQVADGVVSGAAWLSAGSIISRILGAIYVIPWAAWLGAEYSSANGLFSIGYKPYSLFLAIATAGFPSAIAKLMAYFHSKDEYRVADKLFKYSSLVMIVTGLISGGMLFALAPSMAAASATTDALGATLVIRSLVPALLILPFMSLIRGYFQGFNDMKSTAVSQVLEQLARVIYILAATYLIMRVYNGTATSAVVQSTFAAFIGAFASLLYLGFLYIKRLPHIRIMIDQSRDEVTINFIESLKLMVKDSVPFVLLGSGIIIAQLVDTFTFRQILESRSSLLLSEIEQLYGALSLDVDKLMMIIISLAVALATSAVPAVTRLFSQRDIDGTSRLVEQIVAVFSFFMIPIALGMATIATDVYNFFYLEGISLGPQLLITGSVSSIVLGAYTVFSTVLQAMNFRRLAIRYLLVALFIKVILQYPMVALIHAHGALLSTMIGFVVASGLMWQVIKKQLNLDMPKMIRQLVSILISSLLMVVVTLLWHIALGRIFGPTGRFLTFIKIIIEVMVGVFMYGFVMGVGGQLSIIIDDRFKDIQDKIRMF